MPGRSVTTCLRHRLMVGLAVLAVAGCAETPMPARPLTVSGSLAYRERIALPPDGTATVTLSDVTAADRPAPVVAETGIALGGRQVPIPFTLLVDRADIAPGHRYAVEATIGDADGRPVWVTDMAHPVALAGDDVVLGALRLVRFAGGGTTGRIMASFECGDTHADTVFAGDRLTLTVAGRRYDLGRARSASGARYVGTAGADTAMFWDRGSRALLEIGGRRYAECRRTALSEAGSGDQDRAPR